jgi:hypothetical protein
VFYELLRERCSSSSGEEAEAADDLLDVGDSSRKRRGVRVPANKTGVLC